MEVKRQSLEEATEEYQKMVNQAASLIKRKILTYEAALDELADYFRESAYFGDLSIIEISLDLDEAIARLETPD